MLVVDDEPRVREALDLLLRQAGAIVKTVPSAAAAMATPSSSPKKGFQSSFEAVWATALGASDGLSRPVPTVVFFVALALSMAGLGWALKHIPVGTAYAVWTGVGAALTVIYAMATGTETVSPAKIIFLTGIIGAVVGLKLVPSGTRTDLAVPQPDRT